MTTTERSVEEIVREFAERNDCIMCYNKQEKLLERLREIIQAERQKREEVESELRGKIAGLEQQWMFLKDDYSELARAIGVKGDAWFGDPLCSHKEVLEKVEALANPNNPK